LPGFKLTMKTLTLTYQTAPKENGYHIVCLDWYHVFTDAATYEDIIPRAVTATEKMLAWHVEQGKDVPQPKQFVLGPLDFQLTFNLTTFSYIPDSALFGQISERE
jgi:predicted RNase H-like HicB family nuclease